MGYFALCVANPKVLKVSWYCVLSEPVTRNLRIKDATVCGEMASTPSFANTKARARQQRLQHSLLPAGLRDNLGHGFGP